MPPRLKRFAFSLVLVLAVILLGEGALRALALGSRSVEALLSVEPVRSAIQDKELGWRGNPAYPEHDQQGLSQRQASRPSSPRSAGRLADLRLAGSTGPGLATTARAPGSRRYLQHGFPGLGTSPGAARAGRSARAGPPRQSSLPFTPVTTWSTPTPSSTKAIVCASSGPPTRRPARRSERRMTSKPFDGELLAHQDTDGFAKRSGSDSSPG